MALGRKRPFLTQSFVELGVKERRLHAAVDDVPGQDPIVGPVAKDVERGIEAGLGNTRLGAALAMAGQRAEAEAAFRAVTGPRAELAQLWLLWLSTRAG